jgi:predicted dehydrogenase
MDPRRRVGVGLVSVGWMGRVHSRAYRAVTEHFPETPLAPELVIAADPVESGRETATGLLGYREATADYAEVIAHPGVDVVSICSPTFLHREVALAAAAAGKPFWIEKPMGRGVAEARDIAEAAAAAGVVTAVGFNYRNAPAIAHARALIADGALGRITNVRVALLADYSADPAGALTWRFSRERSGSGVLGDLLAHGVDLARHVVGPIASVTGATETFIAERPLPSSAGAGHFSTGDADGPVGPVENEDYAAAIARFENGAVGVLETSRVAVGPHAEYVLEVYGTAGSLRWDFERMNELRLATGSDGYRTVFARPGMGEFGRFQPGAGTGMGFDDLKTIEAERFLRSVAEGRQHGASVADGWSAAATLDAIERSAATGAWVDVPARL